MLGLPAAFDLLVIQGFRPDFTWSWARYRDAGLFGVNGVGSGLFGRARALNENTLISSIFSLCRLWGFYARQRACQSSGGSYRRDGDGGTLSRCDQSRPRLPPAFSDLPVRSSRRLLDDDARDRIPRRQCA